MALIKLGLGYSEIKGKIGGTTFQNYRNSTMAKTRVSGGGRKTLHWNNVKVKFGGIAKLWGPLDLGDKAAWNDHATRVPFIDKFGESYYGSGYQLFMFLNANLVNGGFPPILRPPVFTSNGIINSGEEVEIIGQHDSKIIVVGDYGVDEVMQVFCSVPAPVTNDSRPTRYRLISTFSARDASSPNLYESFRVVFGYGIPDRCSLWFKIRLMNSATGFLSQTIHQRLTIIWPAP